MQPFLIHFSLLSQRSCMRVICPEGNRNHLNMQDEEVDSICQQCSFVNLCQHKAIGDWNSLQIMSCMNNCLCWIRFGSLYGRRERIFGRFSFNPPCVAKCCPVAYWWFLETWSVKNSVELRKRRYLPAQFGTESVPILEGNHKEVHLLKRQNVCETKNI